ncbi:SH3 domain-containing protein [Profundibacter sp.]|uniref:SH3 domain-containing protein n=1 Tax=Profundibacter sp. TaxID=3101071 RepID=UPI003D0DB4C1
MRLLMLLVILTGFVPYSVWARPYIPGLLKVTDGKAQNVRKSPDVTSEIVGTLAHDRKTVEVVALSKDREWGLVNSDDMSIGWVPLQALEQVAPDPVATDFERNLTCFGDEPFWTLVSTDKGGITLSYEGETVEYKRSFAPLLAQNRGFERQVIVAGADNVEITGFLMPQQCRPLEGVFGFRFDLLRRGKGAPVLLSGCCTLGEM